MRCGVFIDNDRTGKAGKRIDFLKMHQWLVHFFLGGSPGEFFNGKGEAVERTVGAPD